MDLKKSKKEYRKYLKEHINNVKLVWQGLQKYTVDSFWLDDYTYFNLNDLISKHDKSKYSKREFEAYRQYFYPINEAEGNKEIFDKAWSNHQKNNKHHWQYWILIEDDGDLIPLDMDFYSIIELLCDWCAMSIKFNNIPSDWYKENKSKIILHNNTENAIKRWLPLFDKVYKDITNGK